MTATTDLDKSTWVSAISAPQSDQRSLQARLLPRPRRIRPTGGLKKQLALRLLSTLRSLLQTLLAQQELRRLPRRWSLSDQAMFPFIHLSVVTR